MLKGNKKFKESGAEVLDPLKGMSVPVNPDFMRTSLFSDHKKWVCFHRFLILSTLNIHQLPGRRHGLRNLRTVQKHHNSARTDDLLRCRWFDLLRQPRRLGFQWWHVFYCHHHHRLVISCGKLFHFSSLSVSLTMQASATAIYTLLKVRHVNDD